MTNPQRVIRGIGGQGLMKVKVLAATIAGGLALALGPAASLAEASEAPSCVSFDTSVLLGRVSVHNGCSSNQRVKIILKNYYDSECKSMSPGENWDHYVPIIQVDRLDRC